MNRLRLVFSFACFALILLAQTVWSQTLEGWSILPATRLQRGRRPDNSSRLQRTKNRGTGVTSLPMDSAANAMGDFTAVSNRFFLVIERDNFEGVNARFKKTFLVDLDQIDGQGFLIKYEVA